MTDEQVLEILGMEDDDVICIQQISNHPNFPNAQRFVAVNLQLANSNAKTFEFWFEIKYIEDGVDVSNAYTQPIVKRIYTDNTIKQLIRDTQNYLPIPNPDWDGISEDEFDKYKWTYGWTMMKHWIKNGVIIETALKQYIILNDIEKFFDQY